jgi:AcrR family transcriptional regulator
MGASKPTTAELDRGGGRVLRARGQRTRARLLEAGATVFGRKGYHAARVDDVVAAARSSHGTFYLYFASKEDLFDQLVAEVASELDALATELPDLEDSDAARAELRAWLNRFADLYAHFGPVLRTWTESEMARVGTAGPDVLGCLTEAMTGRVGRLRRNGLEPAIAALALVTMVERLNYYSATRQLAASRDELLDTLVEVIDGALFR